MKTIFNFLAFVLLNLTTLQSVHADLIDRSTIRYKETPEASLIFAVSKSHAKEVIEPQVSMNWSLDKYKNKNTAERLSKYVEEHTRYQLQHWYGLEPHQIKIDKIHVGYPTTLPEGLMFVSDVRIKQGFFWKKIKAGFVIPSVKGFTAKEIVYFIYPEKDRYVKKTN